MARSRFAITSLALKSLGAALPTLLAMGVIVGAGLKRDWPPPQPAERAQGPLVRRPLSWRVWRHILARTGVEIGQDNILLLSAGVAFYVLLAIFPAMAAFVALYGLFVSGAEAETHFRALASFLPSSAASFIGDELIRIATARAGGLSLTFLFGLIVSLWSANGAVRSLILGLNAAYDERERRGYLKLTLISLAFTLGALGFALIGIVIVSAAPVAALLADPELATISAWVRWPLEALVFYAGIAALYRYGPSCEPARRTWLTWGSFAVLLVWFAASWLLSLYVGGLGHYGSSYGSLAALIAFLMWVYLSVVIVLAGAELNAEYDRALGAPASGAGTAPLPS